MDDKLRVGDTVSWRGGWGKDKPQNVKVTDIKRDCVGKSGTEVENIPWRLVMDRTVIVGLDNSHWAYGDQISQV